MTDRDRLIELIADTQQDFQKWCLECEKDKNKDHQPFEEYLADKFLANGVIVPPCKVGDILFCVFSDKSIDKVYTHIEACKVNEIMFFGDSFVFGVKEINNHYNHNVVLGENAFKKFDEAEAKLKELNDNA